MREDAITTLNRIAVAAAAVLILASTIGAAQMLRAADAERAAARAADSAAYVLDVANMASALNLELAECTDHSQQHMCESYAWRNAYVGVDLYWQEAIDGFGSIAVVRAERMKRDVAEEVTRLK